ncbi:hypothetical protein SAMN04487852_11146 [Prevotella sp. tf2-5]|jgi:hypothetical protein|nr:hypothetical protein SAMN04487852_11146 [Prevotella sp. tf2-5]
MLYFCSSYPENNLFTLKGLIPIEDMKRLPVRVIALFFLPFFLVDSDIFSNFAADLVRGGSVKSWHNAMRHAEKPV